MSFDGAERPWKCGKGGTVNLQKVTSIVRDIGEPCLHQSLIKVMAFKICYAQLWCFEGCHSLYL